MFFAFAFSKQSTLMFCFCLSFPFTLRRWRGQSWMKIYNRSHCSLTSTSGDEVEWDDALFTVKVTENLLM